MRIDKESFTEKLLLITVIIINIWYCHDISRDYKEFVKKQDEAWSDVFNDIYDQISRNGKYTALNGSGIITLEHYIEPHKTKKLGCSKCFIPKHHGFDKEVKEFLKEKRK